MYSPQHYTENREELIYEIIRTYSFATLITQSPAGPLITQLPLLLEIVDGMPMLLGHCARANEHWKQFTNTTPITVIFHGPHSYISPAWYQPKPENVPTWNYVAVHVEGHASIMTSPEDTYRVLKKTVEHFEHEYETGWKLPSEPNKELTGLLNGIVAFQIKIENINAKFKLSQKQNPLERGNVVEQLSMMGEDQSAVAQFMARILDSSRK